MVVFDVELEEESMLDMMEFIFDFWWFVSCSLVCSLSVKCQQLQNPSLLKSRIGLVEVMRDYDCLVQCLQRNNDHYLIQ